MPFGYAMAAYPVPHLMKIVVFNVKYVSLVPMSSDEIQRYFIHGFVARQYRWSGLFICCASIVNYGLKVVEKVDTDELWNAAPSVVGSDKILNNVPEELPQQHPASDLKFCPNIVTQVGGIDISDYVICKFPSVTKKDSPLESSILKILANGTLTNSNIRVQLHVNNIPCTKTEVNRALDTLWHKARIKYFMRNSYKMWSLIDRI
jgi:hypothetical protein